MSFGFSGLSKSLGLFGSSTAPNCAPAPSFGGWSDGGWSGGGSFGGGHGGGLFGGFKGGFGKQPVFGHGRDDDDRDDDDDNDDSSCSTGGGSSSGSTGAATGGTGYPAIAANTAGITFHVDLQGDGIEDDYVPIGRENDTKTFEDYLAKARDQVTAEHPDADPKTVIVKATITAQTGEETYYHFTGLEEDSAADNDQENNDDDDHDNGNDDDCWDRGRDDADDRGGESRSCDGGHADFFRALTGGGLSFDHGDDHDDGYDGHEDDDQHHGRFDFDFC